MRASIPSPVSSLLLAALVAGAHAPPLDAQAASVDDSAGVRIVTSPVPAWSTDDAWTVDPRPVLTVGAVAGPEEELLHQVRDAALLPGGGIAVVNGGTGDVRIYESDGRHRATLGRSGDGPGEFTRPSQVHVRGDDTLVVWDNTAMRIHRFTFRGGHVGTEAHARPTAAGLGAPVAVAAWLLPDGRVMVQLRELGSEPSEDVERPRFRLVQALAGATGWDTLLSHPGPEEVRVRAPTPAGMPGSGGVLLSVRLPHGRTTHVGFGGDPSTICVGMQEDAEIAEIACTEDGSSWRRIRWNAPTVPVDDAEVEAWRRRWAEDAGGSREAREVADAIPAPETRPPHGRLVVDVRGYLWVRIPGSLETAAPGADWWVFDGEGRWLGEVGLPPIRVLEIGESRVVGVRTDDLGVEYVQVHELHR